MGLIGVKEEFRVDKALKFHQGKETFTQKPNI
jgi:hypothetical protein